MELYKQKQIRKVLTLWIDFALTISFKNKSSRIQQKCVHVGTVVDVDVGRCEFTHLVNHQKVMVERKPAVVSGQGFWSENVQEK